jgi:putative salt-induced outer membrane protein
MIQRLFAVTVLFTAFACQAYADQLTLSNGDRVSGKLIKKDGNNLTVKTDLMGEVTIPWDKVVTVTAEGPLYVDLSDGKSLVGKVGVNAKEEKLEVASATSTESAALANVVAIRDPETQKKHERLQNPGWLDLWEGFADFGWSAARGNARTNLLATAFNATRETRTDKITAYFNQIYSKALVEGDLATTANAVRGGWSYNRNLNSRLFATLFNDYEYDQFQDLDLRFVAGGGLGYTALKDDRKRLDLLGGLAYNHEKFNTPLTRNSAEGYWGDDFNYKVSGRAELTQRFRMFHNVSDPGPYRINFDLGLVTTVNRWLSWQLTVSDRFLSNPVFGRQRNDVLYTTGLRIRFAH